MGFDSLPLWVLLALFAGAGGVILVCGVHLTGQADRIADRTGLGEALVGGVLLGAATSLSGTVVSVTAALDAARRWPFQMALVVSLRRLPFWPSLTSFTGAATWSMWPQTFPAFFNAPC